MQHKYSSKHNYWDTHYKSRQISRNNHHTYAQHPFEWIIAKLTLRNFIVNQNTTKLRGKIVGLTSIILIITDQMNISISSIIYVVIMFGYKNRKLRSLATKRRYKLNISKVHQLRWNPFGQHTLNRVKLPQYSSVSSAWDTNQITKKEN